MKAKRITHRNQLVGGQFYIRALANCHGQCWFDIIQIAGKPYRYKGDGKGFVSDYLRSCFQIDQIVKSFWQNEPSERREYFTGDMGADNGGHRQKTLYPFSNKLVLHLTELLNDRRKFCEFLDNKTYTEREWASIQAEWQWQAEVDRMIDASFAKAYYADDDADDDADYKDPVDAEVVEGCNPDNKVAE
jgi:hypothetical protein